LDNHPKLLFIVEPKIMKSNFAGCFSSCVLGVALMLAASKSQADTVVGGQIFAPVNLKLTFTFYDAAGKLKSMAATSKDILLLLGFSKNSQLARGPGNDIFVLDKNVVMTDLTAAGYFSMNFNQLLYTETHPHNGVAFTFVESGTLAVNFYSDAGADLSNGHSSDFWFEVSGAYTGSGSASAIKNNEQTVKENFKSSGLDGVGFDLNIFGINAANSPTVPVSGGASGSGSGKVLASE
jgi:hypothetical protein